MTLKALKREKKRKKRGKMNKFYVKTFFIYIFFISCNSSQLLTKYTLYYEKDNVTISVLHLYRIGRCCSIEIRQQKSPQRYVAIHK